MSRILTSWAVLAKQAVSFAVVGTPKPGEVWLLALAGIAVLVATTLWRLDDARSSTLAAHRVAAENLARSLADNTAAKLAAADILITGLVERLERDGMSDEALGRLRAMLPGRLGPVAGVRALVAYAADGTILAGSSGAGAGAAAAPHLQDGIPELLAHHLRDGGRHASIGQPAQDPRTGHWSISLSKRIDQPDRSFRGITVATLELGDFYSDFELGPHGAVALIRDDGTILVRVPALADRIGVNVADSAIFRAYLADPTAGSGEAASRFGGRIMRQSYRQVRGFPLVVFVSETREDVLAAWTRQAAM